MIIRLCFIIIMLVNNKALNQDKPKVGLEIHQQLDSRNKLFCNCKIVDSTEHDFTFLRILHPTQSEMGSYDQAALFESKKIKTVKYLSSKNSNCLIESDEEPPTMLVGHQLIRKRHFCQSLELRIIF